MFSVLTCGAVMLLHSAGPIHAAENQSRQTDEAAALERQVDSIFAEWDAPDSPGCAVLIVREGKIIHNRGYGMANLEHGIPISGSTVFDTASVSKQFAGLAVAMLVEQGKLSLEEDVRKHLPELPDFGRTITVRHLVHHTSGLRDWPALFAVEGRSFEDVISFEEILDLARRQRDLNFEPGAEFLYSNTGYNLLARIVEVVTGESFAGWTEENMFKPLGMSATRFHDDHGRLVKNRAHAYRQRAGGYSNIGNKLTALGSSSLYSTTEDMAKWLVNLQTGEVGGREAHTLLRQQGVLNDGTTIDYAFGLGISHYRGLKVEQHSGSWAGFRTILAHYPEQQFGVILLGNLASLNPASLARRIADIYLADLLQPVVKEDRSGPEAAFVIRQVDNYQGKYALESGAPAQLVHEKDQWIARVGESVFTLKAESPTNFVNQSTGDRLIAELDESGMVRRFLRETAAGPVLLATRLGPVAEPLERYAGVYQCPELEVVYRIRVEEGGLRVRGSRPTDIRLSRNGPDLFTGNAWFLNEIRFERDDGNEISGFLVSSGRIRNLRFNRVSNPSP